MKKVKNSELLLSYIREGRTMTQREKLWLIVSLSIPSILAQISATVMFFIDASMVGHLGAKASAAIGLVETTGWLMGGLAHAASLGFSVQAAHFIGANDFEAARRVLRQALVCCFIWALMISTTSIVIAPFLPYWLGGSEEIAHDASLYFGVIGVCGTFFQMEGLAGSMLKCSGNMKIPSMLNIGMCVMDVVFNYIFIYILDMGVVGAAIGTGCAELITAILMLYFLLAKSPMLSLRGRPGSFKPKSDTVGTAFKIGAPMGLQHMLMGSAQIVSTLIVAPLGTIAIAAHSLAITVESLCYMPGYGIAEAATTLTGQGIGAGQKQLTRSFANMSVGLGITVMTIMGVMMWIFAPELMSIMSPVEEVIAQGTEVLRIEAWAEPMFAAAIVVNGVFIGAGDTIIPAIMSLGSMWAVRLTLAATLAPRYGLKGVWTAMAIELTFRGSIFLARLFKGGWAEKLKIIKNNNKKDMRRGFLLLAVIYCSVFASIAQTKSTEVLFETTEGNIRIALYDETPQTRDNFLKITKMEIYDSLLIHRVIKNFMIQSGDTNSKHAKPGQLLGTGDFDYTTEAEFRLPQIFHRRGVVAMAREGDDKNPERRSSACQFYIVWGKVLNDIQLAKVQERLDSATQGQVKLTPEMIETYKTVGGTPHLDGQYTVFGEVIEGIDVVEKIQKVECDKNDRPLKDIRILKATVTKDLPQAPKPKAPTKKVVKRKPGNRR